MYKREKTQLERKLETQRVFDYCLFMMLTSYFKSAVCRNKLMEKKMFLCYKEYNMNRVYQLEELAIRVVEEQVLQYFSAEELEEAVEVWLVPDGSSGCIDTLIRTSQGIVEIGGEYLGRETCIDVFSLE